MQLNDCTDVVELENMEPYCAIAENIHLSANNIWISELGVWRTLGIGNIQ